MRTLRMLLLSILAMTLCALSCTGAHDERLGDPGSSADAATVDGGEGGAGADLLERVAAMDPPVFPTLAADGGVAHTEQALSPCATPFFGVQNFFHQVPSVFSVRYTGTGCAGVPFMYPEEPHWWKFSNGAVNPSRTDGRCSCAWTNQPDWNQAACAYSQTFACGYGPGCAFITQYRTTYFPGPDDDWQHVTLQITMNGSGTPNCSRFASGLLFPIELHPHL